MAFQPEPVAVDGEAPVVIGIGETRVGKLPGRTAMDLQAEAVRLAMSDAGISKDRLDGLYAVSPYVRPVRMHSNVLAEFLGVLPRVSVTIDAGGTVSTILMVLGAVEAIRNGRADVVACVFGDNAATGRAADVRGLPLQASLTGTEEFEDPFGALGMVVSHALVAQRYFDRYGLPPECAAPVALAARKHAGLNPNAQYRKPLTLDDYLASRLVASPLRQFDCCPVSDGAGAVVLASKRALKGTNRRHPSVAVLGYGSQVTHSMVSQMPDIDQLGLRPAAEHAYRSAGLGPADVDVLYIHDAFTISVLLALEELGFCEPGKAAEFTAGGGIELSGPLPTNPHGGLLSQAHIGGMLHVVDAVRQLRGEAGQRQVPGAEVAAVGGIGGVFSTAGTLLLGKV